MLAAIRLGPEAAYTVSIAEDIGHRTGRTVRRANVFTALQRLEERGLVATAARRAARRARGPPAAPRGRDRPGSGGRPHDDRRDRGDVRRARPREHPVTPHRDDDPASTAQPSHAPAWARAVLVRLAPPEHEDEVLGDLEEVHRARLERHGPAVAAALTALDTLDMGGALLRGRWRARRRGQERAGGWASTRVSWLDVKLAAACS